MKLLIFLIPILTYAQITVNTGIPRINNWEDGEGAFAWSVGYEHYSKSGIGAAFNYRDTAMMGANFSSIELKTKYRIGNNWYRFEFGGGLGQNLVVKDIYPVVHLRNAFKLTKFSWIIIDLDNSFRTKFGHNEMYFTAGFAFPFDITKIFNGFLNPEPRRNF